MARKRPNVTGALDALLPAVSADDGGQRAVISTSDLKPNPYQPRRTFDEKKLRVLADSIREQGVLQPLLVRRSRGGFELVAGERRLRAARLAGLKEVPVEVRDLSDEQVMLLGAVENLQREGLSVIDEVDATIMILAQRLDLRRDEVRTTLNTLLRHPESNPEQVRHLEWVFSQLGGTWQSFAKNKVRILGWPEPILQAMRERSLGYTLAGIVAAASPEHQAELLERALSGATQAELRAELARRSFQKEHLAVPLEQAGKIAAVLRSRRALERLDSTRRRKLATLLTQIERLLEERTEEADPGGTE